MCKHIKSVYLLFAKHKKRHLKIKSNTFHIIAYMSNVNKYHPLVCPVKSVQKQTNTHSIVYLCDILMSHTRKFNGWNEIIGDIHFFYILISLETQTTRRITRVFVCLLKRKNICNSFYNRVVKHLL